MFDLGKALAPLIFSPATFGTLCDLLEDEGALRVHFQKWQFKSLDEESNEVITRPVSSLSKTLHAHLEKNYREEIHNARLHYGTMMLVTAYTHLEDNVTTFFYEAFLKKPQLMIDYIRRGGGDLSIPLSVLFEKDKDEIINQMAREQSAKATNGDISKVCKRIKNVSGLTISIDLQNRASELQKKRNDIVHEAKIIALDREEIIDSFEIVREMLVSLARAAQSLDIDVDDPAELLRE